MIQFSHPEQLTRLVSGVTEAMFKMSFALAGEVGRPPWKNDGTWRTLSLAITGDKSFSVIIASDPEGGKILAGEMFSCPAAEVDPSMMDDALGELVNIIAGQVKNELGPGHLLGLPKVVPSVTMVPVEWHCATLQNDGTQTMIWVALADTALPEAAAA